MMGLIDHFEMVLSGEDYRTIGSPKNFIEAIERFRDFEKEPNEWIIQAKTGIPVAYVRKLQDVYCKFNNLPSPVRHKKPVKLDLFGLSASTPNPRKVIHTVEKPEIIEKPIEVRYRRYFKKYKVDPLKNDKKKKITVKTITIDKEAIGKTHYYSNNGLRKIPPYSKR